MKQISAFLLLAIVTLAGSCNSAMTPAEKTGGHRMQITVKSSAFYDGEMIPKKHTADGPDLSPPLNWSGIPKETKSIALIVDDPDAPAKVWVHWVLYGLPPNTTHLEEGLPHQQRLLNGAFQGTNDMHKIGYNGPAPPSGIHRYYFKVYALDTTLNLKPGATKPELLAAMEGHVLAVGQIMGRYTRG